MTAEYDLRLNLIGSNEPPLNYWQTPNTKGTRLFAASSMPAAAHRIDFTGESAVGFAESSCAFSLTVLLRYCAAWIRRRTLVVQRFSSQKLYFSANSPRSLTILTDYGCLRRTYYDTSFRPCFLCRANCLHRQATPTRKPSE